ncbi:MAG TPA: RHS repeat-associated core domain-containing protein [Granulicella sp.]|jgi:RHS repeat-associated protein
MMAPLLLACVAGHATPLAPYPTAKVTVNGTEQLISGSWDNANITIDFNGYLETVHYGQYSSDASLASALAAMFTRDYLSFGLYAKAGANSNTDPTVITFQLVNGSSFGPLNVTGPSTSFTFSTTGFAATPSGVPDQGVATLLFNGGAIATASYGDGSTPASIAQDLALKASSSLVTVTAEGPNVYLQSKQTGTYSDTYSLSFSTSLSFSGSPGGTLSGTSETSTVPVYSYNLGYDAVGNITTLNDSIMGNWSYANGYDDLNRLVAGQASTGPYAGQYMCWSYDNFGNRTHQSISNQPFVNAAGSPCQAASGASLIDTAVNYGTNNQISSVTSPALTVAYDGAGNVTNDGNNSYLYDAEGRICALRGPLGMTGYQYDAAGNRVGRGSITSMNCDVTQNGYQPASDYVLDQSGGQMTEVSVGNGQSTWQHTNVTADGTLIATYDTAGLHFYVNDALGSRRVQTDPAGFPEQTCQNLPFGDQLYCTGSLNSPTEHHFTGKERDTESGLDYFGARYFGSNMGRFLSPDYSSVPDTVPYADFRDPQSLNLYSYGLNNPVSNTDSNGHQVTICADGQTTNCPTISDDRWKQIQQQIAAGNSGGVTVDGKGFEGTGTIMCGGSPCGTASYSEEGLHDDTIGWFLGAGAGKFVAGFAAKAFGAVAGWLGGGATEAAGAAIDTGSNVVYRSVNAAGDVQYVGITNNLARRAGEHVIDIEAIPGLSNLSRADARAVEQVLIENHGLSTGFGSNGQPGTLLNKINSIASTNPTYAQSLQRGAQILQQVGYFK